MEKRAPKRKHILRNILLAIAAVPVLFVLYIVIMFLLSPVIDEIDKARFVKLDEQSRGLYEQIKAKSGGIEPWTYAASCDAERSGPWPTGSYYCKTEIVTELVGLSVDQVNALHDKYYGLIDSAAFIEPRTGLDKQLPGYFGVKFVVSSAERQYSLKSDDSIRCTYLIELVQPLPPAGVIYNQKYGADIANGVGRIYLRFTCMDIANGDWYGDDI